MAASRIFLFYVAVAVCISVTTLTGIVSFTYVRKNVEVNTQYKPPMRQLLKKQPLPNSYRLNDQVKDSRCDCSKKAIVFANAIPKEEKEDVLQSKKQELLKYRQR
ncbi:uncharacterized protein LOC118426831 [Branchiostoma floridae]|uniref:Uncharacterized protein LOC118426831 n=1 Tax=Branchiostoma floridae TaxID=7739 RepID=A0A9J7N5H2_BRAFL|nr:uncharacterized protein LOC118426831 [Branchiostoma floridae]